MSYLQELHAAHKERQRRIWRPPSLAKPKPELPMYATPRVIEIFEHPQEAPPTITHVQPPVDGIPQLTVRKIIAAVASYYGVTRNDLVSQRRTYPIVRYRQVACWLAKNLTGTSFPHIGRMMGGRDHTTAMWAVTKIDLCRATDPVLQRQLDDLKSILIPSPHPQVIVVPQTSSEGEMSCMGDAGSEPEPRASPVGDVATPTSESGGAGTSNTHSPAAHYSAAEVQP